MILVDVNTIRNLDQQAIASGIPGCLLMENAGRAVVDLILRDFCIEQAITGRRVVVVCGPGNNGGDGFAIARRLTFVGACVEVFASAQRSKLSEDSGLFYDLLIGAGVKVRNIGDLSAALGEYTPDLIVDALLGTGVRVAPRNPIDEAIRAINSSGAPVVAVDIPSGVDADTGATPGEAIKADATVTFAYPKVGLLTSPGASNAGRITVSEIGFDWRILDPSGAIRLLHFPSNWISRHIEIDRTGLAVYASSPIGEFLLRRRPAEANKGDFGHVGIIAGSRGMCGAPTLAARAAQRAGAGLVTVLCPESAQPAVAAKLNEQMTIALPELDGALSENAFDEIARFASRASVLCVGPGITTSPGTAAVVRRILTELTIPIVLDADGLNVLAQTPDIVKGRSAGSSVPLILTPHPGEAARLLGTSIAGVQSNRIEAVRRIARQYNATVVLKGGFSLVSDPDGNVLVNMSGNPGMASGGMGDALTGIVGGMIARARAPFRNPSGDNSAGLCQDWSLEAVGLSVHLHGLAGDIAADKIGAVGLVAGDLIDRIPMAIRILEGAHRCV